MALAKLEAADKNIAKLKDMTNLQDKKISECKEVAERNARRLREVKKKFI